MEASELVTPAMEQLLASLLNTAGTGVLALVLWTLLNRSNDQFAKATETFSKVHSEIINTFKAEQKAEREMCDKHFNQLAEAMNRNHEVQIKAMLVLDQQQRLLQDHHQLAMHIGKKLEDITEKN